MSMDTRLNINAILDGSIPLSKLAEKVGGGSEPYIWNGTTSETIYNEVIDCIINGRTIMYSRTDTNDDGLYHICISSAIGGQMAYLTFSDTYRHGAFRMLITKDQVLRVQGFMPFYSSNSGGSMMLEAGTYNSINITTNTEIIYDSINGTQQYYEGEFIFGDNAYTITFPDIITWITIPESYKPNTTYQFKILNNIGSVWEVGKGEIAYKSDIPTKVSELENDISIATTTTPGLMSAEDKAKLDQVTAANTSIVTQAEYDALVSAGAATSGTVYYIRG